MTRSHIVSGKTEGKSRGSARKRDVRALSHAAAGGAELTRNDILAAACRLLNRDGVDKFTMRRLAAEIDFSTMAAYRHVESKDDVITAAADTVLGRVLLPPKDGRPWTDRFHDVAMATWAQIETARWIPGYLTSRKVSTPNLSRILTELRDILDDAGLRPEEARRAMVMSSTFTAGLLSLEAEPGPYLRFGVDVIVAGLERLHPSGYGHQHNG